MAYKPPRSQASLPVLVVVSLALSPPFGAASDRLGELALAPSFSFQRGDVNRDQKVDLDDAVHTLESVLTGNPTGCDDAADTNDDGVVDLKDVIFTTGFIFFAQGEAIPAPGPAQCGADPTGDALDCSGGGGCSPATVTDAPTGSLTSRWADLGLVGSVVGGNTGTIFLPPPETTVVASATELREALANARWDIVYVADEAEIDFTHEETLVIERPVTLRSGRHGLAEGGLLFTGFRAEDQRNLIVVESDGVRIDGLRFRGPSDSKSRDQTPFFAIQVPAAHTVTIANNEFFNWTGAGVEVRETENSPEDCVVEPERRHYVRIENNFFHHNQRESLGYGVVAGYGGFPIITGNLFNYNRHAIAADGRARTGYRAFRNLVLGGGGKYGSHYEHHFDMHGRGDPPHYKGGMAGQFVEIAYNTFRGEQDYALGFRTRAAFHLRGRPCDRAEFHHNVLVHERDEAVRWNLLAVDRLVIKDNQYDVDTSREIGVGDFDGDGVDDLLLATGAAWYYSSAGRTEWRLLNSADGRLRDFLLADFDGNGRTDVFASGDGGWFLSADGIGAWRRINGSGIAAGDLHTGDFDGDGRADVFRANGSRWYVSWSGTSAWDEVNASSYKLGSLRFGDFDGDGTTDVFSLANGQWSVSTGARSRWQRLNRKLSSDLDALVVADFDGDGTADIAESDGSRWRVSWSGRTAWRTLRTASSWPQDRLAAQIFGDFDGIPGADALRYEVLLRLANPMNVSQGLAQGARFELSSGARADVVVHSRHDMR